MSAGIPRSAAKCSERYHDFFCSHHFSARRRVFLICLPFSIFFQSAVDGGVFLRCSKVYLCLRFYYGHDGWDHLSFALAKRLCS